MHNPTHVYIRSWVHTHTHRLVLIDDLTQPGVTWEERVNERLGLGHACRVVLSKSWGDPAHAEWHHSLGRGPKQCNSGEIELSKRVSKQPSKHTLTSLCSWLDLMRLTLRFLPLLPHHHGLYPGLLNQNQLSLLSCFWSGHSSTAPELKLGHTHKCVCWLERKLVNI